MWINVKGLFSRGDAAIPVVLLTERQRGVHSISHPICMVSHGQILEIDILKTLMWGERLILISSFWHRITANSSFIEEINPKSSVAWRYCFRLGLYAITTGNVICTRYCSYCCSHSKKTLSLSKYFIDLKRNIPYRIDNVVDFFIDSCFCVHCITSHPLVLVSFEK